MVNSQSIYIFQRNQKNHNILNLEQTPGFYTLLGFRIYPVLSIIPPANIPSTVWWHSIVPGAGNAVRVSERS